MNVESTARDPLSCYVCHNQTEERCSYCLLPVCPEHGEYGLPWFTRRQVLVCTPCQAKLEAIAQEEESLSWAANAQQHGYCQLNGNLHEWLKDMA
jgi:hypothetical protein